MQPESFNPAPTNQPVISQSQVATTGGVLSRSKHLKLLLVIALCELLIAGGVAAYFWRDSQAMAEADEAAQTISDLQSQVEELQSTINQYESSLSGLSE